MAPRRVPAGRYFALEPWRVAEHEFSALDLGFLETVFALGNGNLGVRGEFEEGYPRTISGGIPGTYLNGLHIRHPINYGESAPGFPLQGDHMPAVMSARRLDVAVNGHALREGSIGEHWRELDLRTGLLRRSTQWLLPDGELSVDVSSLVSLAHPGLLAQRIVFRAGDRPLELDVTAWLAPGAPRERDYADPRSGGSLQENLFWIDQWIDDEAMGAAQQAANETIACAVALDVEPGVAAQDKATPVL